MPNETDAPSPFFAAPPFDADDALVQLKRQLRELRLSERGHGFERKGCRVVELQRGATGIDARLAKRPAATPQWTTSALRSSAEVRRFVDTVKQQLARWSDDE